MWGRTNLSSVKILPKLWRFDADFLFKICCFKDNFLFKNIGKKIGKHWQHTLATLWINGLYQTKTLYLAILLKRTSNTIINLVNLYFIIKPYILLIEIVCMKFSVKYCSLIVIMDQKWYIQILIISKKITSNSRFILIIFFYNIIQTSSIHISLNIHLTITYNT